MKRPWPIFLAVGAGLAFAVAFSCKTFDLPAETCDPSSLDAKRALQNDDDCSRCLEDHCCDPVGVCERKSGCAAIVRQTQSCVLDAKLHGASAETTCADNAGLRATITVAATPDEPEKKNLVNPEADRAYRCMRGACGGQCGLPVCKVDKATLLLRNAGCDECFAGGCCKELNGCYENRACKLMLECIIGECGTELGAALKSGPLDGGGMGGPPDGGESLGSPDVLCRDRPSAFGAPACVLNCLCRYRKNDEGLPPADPLLSPFRLAQGVYDCGKAARCGDACMLPRDNGDAQ